MTQCPDNPSQIIQECGDSVPCLYDYTMLNARILGMEIQNSWNAFIYERLEATRHCKIFILKICVSLWVLSLTSTNNNKQNDLNFVLSSFLLHA